jgi:tripeptide aminopeptidase
MDTARSTENVKPVFQNDRITSDGTTVLGVDNRAGVAVLLTLLEHIVNENIEVKDFTVVFTVCEETSLLGSKSVKFRDDIKMGFVFDSYLSPGHYVSSSYGAASFKINIFGKAAHAGIEPEKGISAIQIAAEAINRLNLGRQDKNTTLNIGSIKGGNGVNVVPDMVEVVGEIRSIDMPGIESKLNGVKSGFSSSADRIGGKIEFQYNLEFKPFKINSNGDILNILEKSMRETGLKPCGVLSAGGSDANSFNENGIPSVNLGIGAKNPHSNDEYILFDDLQKSFELAINLVKK